MYCGSTYELTHTQPMITSENWFHIWRVWRSFIDRWMGKKQNDTEMCFLFAHDFASQFTQPVQMVDKRIRHPIIGTQSEKNEWMWHVNSDCTLWNHEWMGLDLVEHRHPSKLMLLVLIHVYSETVGHSVAEHILCLLPLVSLIFTVYTITICRMELCACTRNEIITTNVWNNILFVFCFFEKSFQRWITFLLGWFIPLHSKKQLVTKSQKTKVCSPFLLPNKWEKSWENKHLMLHTVRFVASVNGWLLLGRHHQTSIYDFHAYGTNPIEASTSTGLNSTSIACAGWYIFDLVEQLYILI